MTPTRWRLPLPSEFETKYRPESSLGTPTELHLKKHSKHNQCCLPAPRGTQKEGKGAYFMGSDPPTSLWGQRTHNRTWNVGHLWTACFQLRVFHNPRHVQETPWVWHTQIHIYFSTRRKPSRRWYPDAFVVKQINKIPLSFPRRGKCSGPSDSFRAEGQMPETRLFRPSIPELLACFSDCFAPFWGHIPALMH